MFGLVSGYYSSKLKGKQYRTPHQQVTKLKLKFLLTRGYLNRALNNCPWTITVYFLSNTTCFTTKSI